ncbi:uncharacterized protein K444DRAFT_611493 [Hyaloscypha bicolor E]|uniref:Uncharacterized protein n=1 Tax=Hyaloscypha bicolor E TaxID=1095630 RepID=A0A2J6TDX9_9HELO|nr:uncharacterized protein K444DRAFT_611493 [Hyaloscypha bicolor E]PMD61234.1 hypothetical protein K444DRAFT_611493 [Hyaloscypha bicolor E]
MALVSDTARMKFSDLWEEVQLSALLAVEERFLEEWMLSRIVCTGDSVHKVCSPWLFAHYLWSPIKVFAALGQRMLQLNYAITLLPTVAFILLLLPMVSKSAWGPMWSLVVNFLHRLLDC